MAPGLAQDHEAQVASALAALEGRIVECKRQDGRLQAQRQEILSALHNVDRLITENLRREHHALTAKAELEGEPEPITQLERARAILAGEEA